VAHAYNPSYLRGLFALLGFELRALHLLGKLSTTGATLPALGRSFFAKKFENYIVFLRTFLFYFILELKV
jgi:hypothetical protein